MRREVWRVCRRRRRRVIPLYGIGPRAVEPARPRRAGQGVTTVPSKGPPGHRDKSGDIARSRPKTGPGHSLCPGPTGAGRAAVGAVAAAVARGVLIRPSPPWRPSRTWHCEGRSGIMSRAGASGPDGLAPRAGRTISEAIRRRRSPSLKHLGPDAYKKLRPTVILQLSPAPRSQAGR
jgi:hypothetical protein